MFNQVKYYVYKKVIHPQRLYENFNAINPGIMRHVGVICDKFDLLFTLYILNICTKLHCPQKRNFKFIIYQLVAFPGLKEKG
jgi:hypothetical protein